MIILGNKYKFKELEQARLANNFESVVNIEYDNTDYTKVIQRLDDIINAHKITVVLLNTESEVDPEIIKYLINIQFKKDIIYLSLKKFLEKYLHKCYISSKQKNINYLSSIHRLNMVQYFTKRVIDIIASLIIAMIALLLLPLIIYKMKTQSPGSLLFKQTRIGKKNKPFICYKFRSMHENGHHDPYTRENDNRIYPFGLFMRKTRIDEIPQIINILKGEMHLIGPRAEWDILVKGYEQEIPHYNERHIIAPGITGWAQVMYPYGSNVEDSIQKLMYDLYYIKHWSLWLELKTIFKTIQVVLGKEGV